MKFRRHHNNDGRRQIKTGGTRRFIQRLARSLGVPYGSRASQAQKISREAEHGRGEIPDTAYASSARPAPDSGGLHARSVGFKRYERRQGGAGCEPGPTIRLQTPESSPTAG